MPEKKKGVEKSTALARIEVTEKGAKLMCAEPEMRARISPFHSPSACSGKVTQNKTQSMKKNLSNFFPAEYGYKPTN